MLPLDRLHVDSVERATYVQTYVRTYVCGAFTIRFAHVRMHARANVRASCGLSEILAYGAFPLRICRRASFAQGAFFWGRWSSSKVS